MKLTDLKNDKKNPVYLLQKESKPIDSCLFLSLFDVDVIKDGLGL